MGSVIAGTRIDAPVETLWDLLCDPARYPDYADPADRMLAVPDEPFEEGYTYREYGGVPPFKGESTWTVTVYEPMRRQVHVGDDGAMTLHLTIEVTELDDGGVRLTQRLDLTPRWWLRPVNALLWPLLMRRRAQRAMDRTVENARRMTERDAAGR